MRRARSILIGWTLAAAAVAVAAPAGAARLTEQLGRSDVRVYSAPYPLAEGLSVSGAALPDRLERLGYRRVHRRPERPGEYFWGSERFWFYRREHRHDGTRYGAELIGLAIEDGRIAAGLTPAGERYPLGSPSGGGGPRGGGRPPWIEPETLAESLIGDRAPRVPVPFDQLPERVWRPLLAAEDARFFEHSGLDGRAIARAAIANLRAGEVAQGGSTITQQLVKMRDLTPRRTIGRKVSEAVRALVIEAEHDKEEILEAYLDHVYLGHVHGVALHGYGAAARAWFAKDVRDLTLGEAALIASVVQAPNRFAPLRHTGRVERRRQWVLDRLAELGWASPEEIEAARRPPRHAAEIPERRAAGDLVRWVGALAAQAAPERAGNGRGFVIETTIDAELQRRAEQAVATALAQLGRARRFEGKPLSAALIALDAETGAILAHVGGDPGDSGDQFDRARHARRQPGSTVKPLVLLEAFDRCGGNEPLTPATRVADRPLVIELPSGPWRPANPDEDFRDVVTLRRAVAESLNVPFARAAEHCGFEAVAERFRAAGLAVPAEPPPSFVLGAVETTPLHLAEAYTIFATPGLALRPFPATRIERPSGRAIASAGPGARQVVRPASAYLVRDLLRGAIAGGTASAGAVPGIDAAGKTGTSSASRDAWFAGDVGSVVAVVWVGLDDDSPLGLSGAYAAAPIWRDFMAAAAAARPPRTVPEPEGVVHGFIDPRTGRRVRESHSRAEPELFREGAEPPRRRIWRPDPPLPPVL